MSHEYFHAFVPGWNSWYLVSLFLLLVGFAISCIANIQLCWVDDRETGLRLLRYRKVGHNSSISMLQGLAVFASSTVVVYLVRAESWAGLQQYARNYVVAPGSNLLQRADLAAVVILCLFAALYAFVMYQAVWNSWRFCIIGVAVVDLIIMVCAIPRLALAKKRRQASHQAAPRGSIANNPRS